MVGARSAQFGGHGHARPRPQLVGVNMQAHPAGGTRRQHRAALVRIEGAFLTERIDRGRDICDRIQHGPPHLLHVRRRRYPVGHNMRTQECAVRRNFPGYLQAASLLVDSKPVPGFDFQRRGPRPQGLDGETPRPGEQFRRTRCPGCRDGGANSPRGVRPAGQPRLEFLGPVTAEDQVRVRVHETWQDGSTTGVDPLVGRRRVRRGTYPGDPAVRNHQRGMLSHR